MAMFLSGVFWASIAFVCLGASVLPWLSAPFDYPGVLGIFRGIHGFVRFVPVVTFILLVGPAVFVEV